MTTTRLFAASVTVAALAAGGVAAAAETPVVGEQGTLNVTRAPVTFPGTGVKKGERLPSGARVIFRDVTLEGEQEARLRLRAPRDRTLRGLAIREGAPIGVATVSAGSYVGRRQVVVRAYLRPDAEGETTSRVYAITR
jgi:hypothetical protein